jgi:hypothetical protein
MQSFINELSLPALPTNQDVVGMFSALGKCYKDCRAMGLREIKVHSTFYNHQFAPGYSFLHWVADHNADEDLRVLLKSVMGTMPFVDEILVGYENENNVVLKMEYNNQLCIGLGLASNILFHTVTLSYDAIQWSLNEYPVSVTIAEEDATGNIVENVKAGTAFNISADAHVATHQHFINTKVKSTIQNGRELWLKREELFPNLHFCDLVREQIASMNANTMGFQIIIERLFDLQNVAVKCTGVGVKPADFPTLTTPESDSRLKDFSEQLTIKCPDGEKRLFSWHSRFTPGAGRIHFIPYEERKIFLVGSIANQNRIK